MIDYQIRLKKFVIRNFRKFEELPIDFDGSSISILAGRNATGKTSILEAINLALTDRSSKFTNISESDFNSEEPIILEVEFNEPFFFSFDYPSGGHSGLIPCFGFTKTINRRKKKEIGKFFSSEYEIKTEYKMKNFLPTDQEFNLMKGKIKTSKPSKCHHLVREFKIDENGICSYRKQSDLVQEYSELPQNSHVDSFKYNIFPKILYPQIFYFDSNRERELLPQYNTAFSSIISELDWRFKREFLKDSNTDKKNELFDIFEKFHKKINKLDSHEKELITPSIDLIKNDFGIDISKNLKIFSLNIFKPYSNAILGKITEQNQNISATDFGSGISMLLSISLSVSFAEKTKYPIVILIDEPELHLHSDLQKKLFNFLKDAKFQAILSTHSHLLVDKENFENNHILDEQENEKIVIKKSSQIDVADLQFRLLGNSFDDLYIPERILVVEGKYDKNLINKCLNFMDEDFIPMQIIDVGGKDNMLDKSEKYQELLDEILKRGKWYSDAIIKILKIIVDGDVPVDKINNWVSKYGFNKDKQINHLDPINRFCMENFLLEILVRKCINDTALRDNTLLRDKDFDDIIKIIISDDKESNKDNCIQQNCRISKSRLNEYVVNNITKDIFDSEESKELKKIISWLIFY